MLADFGLAQSWRNTVNWTPMGTLDYMSPELVDAEDIDTPEKRVAIDWWAAAICLYEMKTKQHVSPSFLRHQTITANTRLT